MFLIVNIGSKDLILGRIEDLCRKHIVRLMNLTEDFH